MDIDKELDSKDLRAALAFNRSKRLVDKIKMVYRLYSKIRVEFFAGEETEGFQA